MNVRAATTLFAIAFGFASLAVPRAAAGAPDDPRWDPAAATQYLDARMDAWWVNAKVLKTGDGEARCVSCHTAVPYVLARPALRRLAGLATPTAHEQRIADTAKVRVDFADRKQPFYDNSEDKKRESRGVESVLNALVLASWDADRRASHWSVQTEAALSQMWAAQRADGAWDWLNFGLEPFEAPDAVFHGASLAAIAVGIAGRLPGSSSESVHGLGMERLRGYLSANVSSQRLFNQAWALLAAARLDGVLSAAQREAIVDDLKGQQRPDGGWALTDLGTWRWDRGEAPFGPPGDPDEAILKASDGYATGLVIYALRQARVPATDPVVVKGRAWLASHQQAGSTSDPAWAPWRAHSLNHDREHGGPRGEPWRRMFMSDLATAFAVLGLTE